MRAFFLILCYFVFSPGAAFAQWIVDDPRTLGRGCVVSKFNVDEAKLTLKFADFSVGLGSPGSGVLDHADCAVTVRYRIPARHRLITLTHRVFAFARKNQQASVSLDAFLKINENQFSLHGTLPAGAEFSDVVLLYKAFEADGVFPCSTESRLIDVSMDWSLASAATTSEARALLSLSGEDLGIDAWIVTEPCESAGALTGTHVGVR